MNLREYFKKIAKAEFNIDATEEMIDKFIALSIEQGKDMDMDISGSFLEYSFAKDIINFLVNEYNLRYNFSKYIHRESFELFVLENLDREGRTYNNSDLNNREYKLWASAYLARNNYNTLES